MSYFTHSLLLSSNRYRNYLLIALLVVGSGFLSVALAPSYSLATGNHAVSGRYQKTSGDTVIVLITVGSPAPQSLILEQYLPPGVTLLETSPTGRQISNSGVVKWLFKNVSPGSFEVRMRLSPATAAHKIGGTIRYRTPGSGKMQEVRVKR